MTGIDLTEVKSGRARSAAWGDPESEHHDAAAVPSADRAITLPSTIRAQCSGALIFLG
jgi:hypothetical protein